MIYLDSNVFIYAAVGGNREGSWCRDLIRRIAPNLFLSLSSDVAPKAGEYARTATVAMNGYIGPLLGSYVETLGARTRAAGLGRDVLFSQCTGGVLSEASTIDEVVDEIAATRITERGETRADDRVSEAAMEDRKRVGYF